jgi:NAD(P)-dependent dehydrogenase (short-subunit alcohol dehydrogenase family)
VTTRVATPFGATSTAMEVLDGVDLTGRVAVVTGGSSGLGVETARALAAAGAQVVLAVRSPVNGTAVADEISRTTGNTAVSVQPLDLMDLGSVDAFVDGWRGPLDILVDNAGVMACPLGRTAHGWEAQFATNHLGHFALSVGLHKALATAETARVVVVSSVGHVNGDVDFDDLHFERRRYEPFAAYAQSKTANVLFAVEAARRWATDGIAVNALNPGRIMTTNLLRHLGDALQAAPASFDPTSTDVSYKNAEQGAATSALLAGSPLLEGVTGRYFEDCQEAGPHIPGVLRGVAAYALDPEHAARLWTVSTDLLTTARR